MKTLQLGVSLDETEVENEIPWENYHYDHKLYGRRGNVRMCLSLNVP